MIVLWESIQPIDFWISAHWGVVWGTVSTNEKGAHLFSSFILGSPPLFWVLVLVHLPNCAYTNAHW